MIPAFVVRLAVSGEGRWRGVAFAGVLHRVYDRRVEVRCLIEVLMGSARFKMRVRNRQWLRLDGRRVDFEELMEQPAGVRHPSGNGELS